MLKMQGKSQVPPNQQVSMQATIAILTMHAQEIWCTF